METVLLFIIPFQGEATVEAASLIFWDGVVLFDGFDEVVPMLFIDIFYVEVIYY